MVAVNFKLEDNEKKLLGSLCALKGEKQQDILREIVVQWIERNRFILSENEEQNEEIIVNKKAKKNKLP
jgi:hypothetical protein